MYLLGEEEKYRGVSAHEVGQINPTLARFSINGYGI